MDKENVELIDDEVITLYDDNNKPVEFYQVACVEYEDEFYALLQPVEPLEGLGEDEALVFKMVEQEDGDSDLFVPVEDEELLNAVFNEYLIAVAAQEEGCSCCGHDGCDCDHDGCGHDGCDCDHDGCGHDGCDCDHEKK